MYCTVYALFSKSNIIPIFYFVLLELTKYSIFFLIDCLLAHTITVNEIIFGKTETDIFLGGRVVN